jgi:HPt (histidine-containing phosphotransfer) domain-containing protein
MVDELELAVLMKDDGERRRLAHELTGSCSALGAKHVQEVAMEMQLTNNDEWEKNRLLLKDLKQSYEKVKVVLIAYIKQG